MELNHQDISDMRLALAHRREALMARTKLTDDEYGEPDEEIREELRAEDAAELQRVLVLITKLDDERKQTADLRPANGLVPTQDDEAGMRWWNGMTVPQRSRALEDAGWKAGNKDVPSPAEAWAEYKRRRGVEAEHADA